MRFYRNTLEKNLKTVEKDTDRDNFLNAEDSKKYGIIDDILEERG